MSFPSRSLALLVFPALITVLFAPPPCTSQTLLLEISVTRRFGVKTFVLDNLVSLPIHLRGVNPWVKGSVIVLF